MSGAAAIPLRLLPLLALGLLLLAMVQSPLRVAPDAALNIETGELLLEGKRPYVDFVELNPPLIMYVNTFPALLARATGLAPVAAFNALFFLLLAWSTWAIRRQLAALAIATRDLAPDLVAAVWVGFSLFLWMTAPLDVNDFGQREHIFILTWMPYFLLRCRPGPTPGTSRLGAASYGIAAGIGCCLKPHFIVLALAVEVASSVTRRSFRSLRAPESFAFVGFALLYAVHFALLPAEVREAFFGHWLPFAAKYYSTYRLPNAASARPLLRISSIIGCAAALAAQWPRLRASARGAVYAGLGVFTAGAVAVYYWQDKGFFYHQIPALAGVSVLCTLALADALSLAFARLLGGRLLALAVVAVAVPGWWMLARAAPSVVARRDDGNHSLGAFRSVVETFAEENEPIAILSLSAWPEYPTLAQLDRRQATRFLSLMYLSLAIAARQDGDGGRSEDSLLQQLADDFRERRPPVIVIWSRSCPQCGPGGLMNRLLANESLASVLRGYERRTQVGLPGGSVLLVRPDRAERKRKG